MFIGPHDSSGPNVLPARGAGYEPAGDDWLRGFGFVRHLELARKFASQPFIVVIEKSDPLVCTGPDTRIARGRAAKAVRELQRAQTDIVNFRKSCLRGCVG